MDWLKRYLRPQDVITEAAFKARLLHVLHPPPIPLHDWQKVRGKWVDCIIVLNETSHSTWVFEVDYE